MASDHIVAGACLSGSVNVGYIVPMIWLLFALAVLTCGAWLTTWVWRKKGRQRGAQAASALLFVALFLLPRSEWAATQLSSLYLLTDPLIALVSSIASRAFLPLFLLSGIVIALSVLLGRVYCSHVCPMGILLDISDRWLIRSPRPSGERHHKKARPRLRQAKYVLLMVILVAALFRVDLLGFGDPVVLVTRAVSHALFPLLETLRSAALHALLPIFPSLSRLDIIRVDQVAPSLNGAALTVGFLVVILLLSRIEARFWCRYLCPLGALLSLPKARWSVYRKRRRAGCDACDQCAQACPMGAISRGDIVTDAAECITCEECVASCPKRVVGFSVQGGRGEEQGEAGVLDLRRDKIDRRAVLGGVTGGVVIGLCHDVDLLQSLILRSSHRGPDRWIRPPGAVPDDEFLARCMRCGECVRACPTHTLQLDWYRSGLEGLWTPRMDLRHAPCEPTCHACGRACPTGAIRPLSGCEREHASVGTARILRERCLPWAASRRCLICNKCCPYEAIILQSKGASQADLPRVDVRRCNGCGLCEASCPVSDGGAILVTSAGEVRRTRGSYVKGTELQLRCLSNSRRGDPA